MTGDRLRPTRRGMCAGAAALSVTSLAVRGRSPDAFDAVKDLAMAQASTSILVSLGGRILAERYAPGWGPERPREVASVGKSLVAILLAMAVEDGHIRDFDQSAADFIPAWKSDARAGITLRHMMSMTSGLDDTGLALRGVAGDQFAINSAAPLRHPPGTRWAYNTATYHLLFHVLVEATGRPLEAYAHDRLLGPLGMSGTHWITAPGHGARGSVTNYYSAAATPRDLARLGEWVAAGGVAAGERLLRADLLQTLLEPSQALNPSYGLLWWANARPGLDAFGRGPAFRFPSAPRDTVAALGAGGQYVLIVPSRQLVVIRQGDPPPAANLADDLLAGSLAALDGA